MKVEIHNKEMLGSDLIGEGVIKLDEIFNGGVL